MEHTTATNKDILLAEDDRDDVMIFELAIDKLNIAHQLRHAENGEVLFDLLEERVPDILFLDIMMPCRDGAACVLEIRKNRNYDGLPVIMYTSLTGNPTVETCFRNGANLFLEKTNTVADLVEKLRKVFSIDWKNYMHYPPLNQFVLS
ncbi:MAG: response regulator [Sphingobacteriales bacterium]|nr:MAG: response regulator [Sphingobacteriales bacterium]